MRESKYRAWIKNADKMVDVIAIDLEKEEICWIFDDYVNWEQERVWIGFDDIALMQYTGLKDKNDVEIYEGDILNIYQHGHVVAEFAEGCYGAWDHYGFSPFRGTLFGCGGEVLGNIYENPELMTLTND